MAHSLTLALGQPQDCVANTALLNAFTVHLGLIDACAERNLHLLLELLGEAGARGTFFVLGSQVERNAVGARLVRRIQQEGHEIGSQGQQPDPLCTLSPEQLRLDLRRSRRILEDFGKPVTVYRAPGFSIKPGILWALDVLIETGFTLDSSLYPTRLNQSTALLEPHRIERAGGHLWEFPAPVWPVLGWPLPVGGGRSFRLYPYALTRRLLQGINAAGRPFAFYLGPRDLHHTVDRLRRLLHDFTFATISQALERLAGAVVLPTYSHSQAA